MNPGLIELLGESEFVRAWTDIWEPLIKTVSCLKHKLYGDVSFFYLGTNKPSKATRAG